jgi:AhpD family alkylhydroperoxidase
MAIINLNTSATTSIRMKLLFCYEKIKYGKVLEPVIAWGYAPQIFFKFLKLWNSFNKKNLSIDQNLKSLICLFISKQNQCNFCINLHSSKLTSNPTYKEKIAALNDFTNNEIFSTQEKSLLEYAKYMTNTPVIIPKDVTSNLKQYYNDKQIVEITALIAFQNMSSRFNAALKLSS